MATFPRHDAAVGYLRHCLGVHESPDGSNRGPVQVHRPNGGVDAFQEHDFVAGVGYAWCVTAWLAALDYAELRWPWRSPGAYSQGNWARQHGFSRPPGGLIPGDGCVWSVGSGHLSTFLSYNTKRHTITTIDGNSSNRVAIRERSASLLHTGIHVPEDPTHPMPPVAKPYWVIATSENGHRQLLYTKFATEKTVLGILPRLLKQHGRAGITIKRSKPVKR